MVRKIQQASALLLAKSFEKPQLPAFQMVKVTLTHDIEPVGALKVNDPFFKPTVLDRPESVDGPSASDLSGTNPLLRLIAN